MRHRVYGKHLGRTKNQRTALFKSLVQALLVSETIETTQTKAKAVKGLVDKLITAAKSPTTRNQVESFLVNKKMQSRLIDDIMPRLGKRTSGYTSVVKVGRRLGDGAMIVRMSLLVEKAAKAEKSAPAKKADVKKTETLEAKAATAKTVKAEPKKEAAKKTVKKGAKK